MRLIVTLKSENYILFKKPAHTCIMKYNICLLSVSLECSKPVIMWQSKRPIPWRKSSCLVPTIEGCLQESFSNYSRYR